MNRKERRRQAKSGKVLAKKTGWQLFLEGGMYIGRFQAMASPCEVLLEATSHLVAEECVELAFQEVRRIERKFSRYLPDNLIDLINRSQGKVIAIDEEAAKLFAYAGECYTLSEGLFDITSGVLRRAWKFDGSNKIPSQKEIDVLISLVGWKKVKLTENSIQLEPGMEVDLGGIAKEYAVDRVAGLLKTKTTSPFLVNFGGDLFASAERKNGQAWVVGIESPEQDRVAIKQLKLKSGGLATSGDARRFLLKEGKRYGHILNPKTGWPVEFAPRSVSVASSTCTEAGILSTIAQLQGSQAENFLEDQQVKFWCFR